MSDQPPPGEQVLDAAVPLLGAAEALGALGASLRIRHHDVAVAPELAAAIEAVLDALGIRAAVDALPAPQATTILGVVEGFLTQAADFAGAPGREAWDHEDVRILTAQGHSSVLVARALEGLIVPSIGGDLAERLEADGAAFLDVGVGVGSLAVAMCRTWPSLRVVGVDPWEPALAIAREQVAAAGLEDRIELRRAVCEQLDDSDAYDLAWVPTFFIPLAALQPAVDRVHAAMRPGGWATLGLFGRPPDPLAAALADLRTVRQGGALITPQDAMDMLTRAGFVDVGLHFDPEWGLPVVFVAGRRG